MKKHFLLLAILFLNLILFGQQVSPKIFTAKLIDSNKQFKDTADFSRATFAKGADFRGAIFSKDAEFWTSQFLDTADFSEVNFFNDAIFSSVRFSKRVDFNLVQFKKRSDFDGVEFNDDAAFSGTTFKKCADFTRTQFKKRANFSGTQFFDAADFLDVHFSKEVDFEQTIFGTQSNLNLSSLYLTDSTSFDFLLAVFPDTIYFENNSNIKNEINFTNADFSDSTGNNKTIWIDLSQSDIAKLHLDYVHFRLLLLNSSIDKNASIYESLLNNFKTNGQTESYKLLDVEYQEFKWRNSLWTKYIVWIPKWWWNFGYDKEYIFVWTIVFLVLLTCFSYFFIHSLNIKIYKIENIPVNNIWIKKWSFADFKKRLWFSFMYTSTVFFKLSVDIKNLQYKERRGTFYIIVVYTIGVLCIAYMANFVLQKT